MSSKNTPWVILLRGINVGGKHIVKMKELVSSMTSAGFTDVRTYIQSGNIVCHYPESPARAVGDLIEKDFGFRPEVYVFSAKSFQKKAADNPYPANAGKAVHIFFMDPKPKSVNFDLLDELKSATEDYTLKGSEFYLHAPDGIGRSKLVEKIGKAFPGTSMTARNLNTINKLLEML